MFVRPGLYYFNQPDTIYNKQNWLFDTDKIQRLKKYNLVIADFSSEHYGVSGIDHIYQELEQQEINFILFSHEPSDHLRKSRMLHYMHWHMWGNNNFKQSNDDKITRTYKWSCLNGIPRPHRIYNLVLSRQKSYYNDAFFNFHTMLNHNDRVDDVEIDSITANEWKLLQSTTPHISKNGLNSADITIPAYCDSYIHLITETTVMPRIFISEKTWKPVAAGQIFLVFGNPGTVAFLRSVGVDVFDDIIDHTYDSESDWKLRLNKIHLQLERLMSMDLVELYKNTHTRRKANSDGFFSKKFVSEYNTQIVQAIDRYIK